ncbi:MAG: acetate--CoA ligase [Opitutales bacterium]
MAHSTDIETVLKEDRSFPPSAAFSQQAHLPSLEAFRAEWQRSIDDPEGYWSQVAGELDWFQPWETVLNASEAPFFKWFEGGKTNLCHNCVDRHLAARSDKPAIIWEGEPGTENERKTLSFAELQREVVRFANVLKRLGVNKGDIVTFYLGMVPELAIGVLACARIGAVHSVIFAGFSADSIRDRVSDAQSKFVITGDGGWRRGKVLPLKAVVDEALEGVDFVEKVLVVKRNSPGTQMPCAMQAGRDVFYDALLNNDEETCPCAEQDAEDMLFLLYTSGSTGKPKGIMHTTGGYMVYAYQTSKYTFDLKEDDVYWCTADIGWITGHSYLVYGPLLNGATVLMYEGAPNYPDEGRFWDIVERHKVSIFYTAPTAIRAFMKWGDQWPQGKDLSSLRLLGTVGEPINPEAWMWYHQLIGGARCPIVDTWWQTETGGHMITPMPGATPTKPGSATLPFPGIDAAVIDEAGNEVEAGYLAIRKPWPGMLRGVWGDPQRYRDTYWPKWDGKYYFPGDGARRDADGFFWIVGRVDDVVNVSGHRIGTAELESVFVEHSAVAETAVIGIPHEIKGQGLLAFVITRGTFDGEEATLISELQGMVDKKIGKFARPEKIVLTADLPKTRSGKIMRRLLRDIAEGRELGNVTTLADPSIVDSLRTKFAQS